MNKDLISRQDAIKEVSKYVHSVDMIIGNGTLSMAGCMDVAEEILEGLPSMESEPKWILCSEELPEENGQYLITIKYKHFNDSYEDVYTEHGEWLDGKWDMFCFGHCGEAEDIIAWLPLPEPLYKEEQDGNK